MKKRNILTTSIMLTLIAGVATTVSAEPSLLDYKEVTSAYEDAYITGWFNMDSGNQDQTSYNLDLTADYKKVFYSPNRNTTLNFLAEGYRRRGPNVGDPTTSDYKALGDASVLNYFQPGSKGSFWYGQGEIGARKVQEDPFTKLTVGLGYGRVVNVTPMARAIRVIQELRKLGNLAADPSKATYQAVAEIVSKESEYRSKYGNADYEQYWVEDIEEVLKTSGQVTGSGHLGARAILKSYDVLAMERIYKREHGWLVRAGAGAVMTEYNCGNGWYLLELITEYHHPFSNQTQFSNVTIATSILDDENNDYTFFNAMSLTHELTDRVDWENRWMLHHYEWDSFNDMTLNTVSSTFRYYLTNQLDFNVRVMLEDVEDNVDGNGNDELDKSLNMGITYRLK